MNYGLITSKLDMAGEPKTPIPVLTEEIGAIEQVADEDGTRDKEALIAELQTQIAASAFTLTDEIMRKAFAEMEASIFEEISSRLRTELPELIDAILRERLGNETDD